MHTLRTLLAPIAALILLLAACGQEPTTPTPNGTVSQPASVPASAPASPSPSASGSPDGAAGTPDGWQRIAVDEDGFSLAVPEGWEELSADVLADPARLDELRAANPDAAEALEQGSQALESGQIALFAFDPDVRESGFATNVNVINVGPVTGSAEDAARDVAAAVEAQIPTSGEIETETTVLPAGDAAVVRYAWDIASAEGEEATPVTVTQYAILAESGTGFILSMSTATEDAPDHEGTFRQIAESFREPEG